MLECALVRVRVILILLLLAAPARADIIHLKNGRSLAGSHVRVNGNRVEYEIAGNSYAIPASLVERIEPDPPAAAPGPIVREMFAPAEGLEGEAQVTGRLIRGGEVDAQALAELERAGNPTLTATGFFVAGRHAVESGDRERARFYFERALMFAPDNPIILTHYAAVLAQMGRAQEAVPAAERAARRAPHSADAAATLGFVYFGADRSLEAIRAWKRALQLRPDATVERFLSIARRELAAEAMFSQTETGHFRLRYEGKQTPPELRTRLIELLEQDYADLEKELGAAPASSIPVILYADAAFVDVTRGPSWTDAIYDGKLRLNLRGRTELTSEFARHLRHELAHSFIIQASRGRCPQWLNEGIAQSLEPQTRVPSGRLLSELYEAHSQVRLSTLEASFLQFSPSQAMLAYDESLAAVVFIRERFGMPALREILVRIGEGASTESALRATLKLGYAELEAQLAAWLKKNY